MRRRYIRSNPIKPFRIRNRFSYDSHNETTLPNVNMEEINTDDAINYDYDDDMILSEDYVITESSEDDNEEEGNDEEESSSYEEENNSDEEEVNNDEEEYYNEDNYYYVNAAKAQVNYN